MFSVLLMVLGPLLGITFTGLLVFALFTYIRRSWQVIRSEADGSVLNRLLDELDRLRVQNHVLFERLDRIEDALGEGLPGGQREAKGSVPSERGPSSIPPPGRGDHGVLPR